MDNMDVFCRQEDPYPRAQCIIQPVGGLSHHARFDVRDDIASQCVLHEAFHLELRVLNGNHCTSHKKDCGWDEARLELLTERFLNAVD